MAHTTHQPLSYREYQAHAEALCREGNVEELFEFAGTVMERADQLDRCKSFTASRQHQALADKVYDWAEELDC